jgi:hypothetical protein
VRGSTAARKVAWARNQQVGVLHVNGRRGGNAGTVVCILTTEELDVAPENPKLRSVTLIVNAPEVCPQAYP